MKTVYEESYSASPCNEAWRELQVIDFFTSRQRLYYLPVFSFHINFDCYRILVNAIDSSCVLR